MVTWPGHPPPSRPVVSGNTGLNCHLSELISHIIDPIAFEQDGSEVDSTDDLLYRIGKMNERIKNGEVDSVPQLNDKATVNTENIEKEVTIDDANTGQSERFKTGDIRNFGVCGKKTKDFDSDSNKQRLRDSIDRLRNSRQKGSLLPNLKDRLKASKMIDVLEEGDIIKLPRSHDAKSKMVNKQRSTGISVVGSDVVSLFPSLKNVESYVLRRFRDYYTVMCFLQL